MAEILEWITDGIVWMEDEIYEIYQRTDETFQSLSKLITDFDSFIEIATIYLYLSGLALFVILIMCIVNANNTKLLKKEIQLLRGDLINQEGDNTNGEHDDSIIQGNSCRS